MIGQPIVSFAKLRKTHGLAQNRQEHLSFLCSYELFFIPLQHSSRNIFRDICFFHAPVAELVDALDLGSSCSRSAGSSPVRRTTLNAKQLNISCLAF